MMRQLLPCLCCLLGTTSDLALAQQRPNVLFIAVDDLRPQLGCYGQSQMVTPNIDRLAAQGTLFNRSYCMVPTCGASRASLMTSIRPARNRFINHLAWAERDAKGITTLNTHFKTHGYTTLSNGKVFHHPEDNAQGWSEPAWRPNRTQTYLHPDNQATAAKNDRGPAYESADVADDAYADGQLAQKAIDDLRRLKEQNQPFFLAVGFFKPHLPFVAPKKYWDLYEREQIQLPDPYAPPQDAPDEAIHNSGELRAYAGIPKTGVLPEELARTLIHGYYACVSYTDAQVGKVLDELNRLGLADNTIVVLWGDHGWNLGEHTLWCKHCCFETSMRTAFIVKAPGVAGGQKTDGLIEYIDVYPSLCELAGLPVPAHVQGRSFVPLLRDPAGPGKEVAVGRFQNGDTIRTDTHRYSEYTTPAGAPQAHMLYDHDADPGETVNLSLRAEHEAAVRALRQQLHETKGQDNPVTPRARRQN
jgi:iduronate 2-sulfatase